MTTTVTDAQIADFFSRTNELYRRMTEGALAPDRVIAGLDSLINEKHEAGMLSDMIAVCGFRRVDRAINERNFPLSGPVADVKDMVALLQRELGPGEMNTAGLKAAIDRKGYRPATLAELLAYANAKWNGRDFVVALGSSSMHPVRGRDVPCLSGGGGRALSLDCGFPDDFWVGSPLFLVVRQQHLPWSYLHNRP